MFYFVRWLNKDCMCSRASLRIYTFFQPWHLTSMIRRSKVICSSSSIIIIEIRRNQCIRSKSFYVRDIFCELKIEAASMLWIRFLITWTNYFSWTWMRKLDFWIPLSCTTNVDLKWKLIGQIWINFNYLFIINYLFFFFYSFFNGVTRWSWGFSRECELFAARIMR